jgi:hypothetical protein
MAADERLFLERTALAAAADACALLDGPRRTALEAGRLQARNAVLRAGASWSDVARAEGEARRIGAAKPCTDATLRQEITRLGVAFRRYQLTPRETYAGTTASWQASRSRVDGWHVVQTLERADLVAEFGLRRIGTEIDATDVGELTLRLSFAAPVRGPSAATLHVRDTARAPEPWLQTVVAGPPTPAPRPMSRAHFATRRTVVTGDAAGVREMQFIFPARAVAALQALHPQERFEIELATDPRNPAAQMRLVFEAGDFAAAHAFASLPPL